MLQGGDAGAGVGVATPTPGLAAAPQVGPDSEAHTQECGDRGRPERQAAGAGQGRRRSRSSSRNLGRRRPLALLDLTHHLGAAGLGHGLGQGEADTGDVGLLTEAQASDAGDRGENGVEGGVAEDGAQVQAPGC